MILTRTDDDWDWPVLECLQRKCRNLRKEVQVRVACAWTIARSRYNNAPARLAAARYYLEHNTTAQLKAMLIRTAWLCQYAKETMRSIRNDRVDQIEELYAMYEEHK